MVMSKISVAWKIVMLAGICLLFASNAEANAARVKNSNNFAWQNKASSKNINRQVNKPSTLTGSARKKKRSVPYISD